MQKCGYGAYGGKPGFDLNSSSYNVFTFISKDCNYGARLLDNCWGNVINGMITGATRSGSIYNNQPVNVSSNNMITLAVEGGCADYGISVGVNVTNSAINATIRNVNGYGIRDTAQIPEANTPQGNRYHISTSRCQLGGYYIEGINGVWNIISQLDGRVGAQGSSFAVDLYGSGNVFTVTGNTGIATITPIASVKGRMVILLFTGTSIVTNSTGNLKLSGNFITTPNSTLTLLWDGTNFVETGRSLK